MNRAGKVTGGAFPEWYVKKPIPVEAIMATMENREECEKFCPDFKCANSKTPSIVGTIKTLEGEMMVVYEDEKTGTMWVRKKEEFLSPVDTEKYPNANQFYRFEECDE